jgi:hypothetical protein
LFIFSGVVLAIAVALLVGGLLVVAFFTAAVELVIDDVSILIIINTYYTKNIISVKLSYGQKIGRER